jgi:cell division septation protein DedD
MVAETRPTREGPGILATLGGALLLVVLGFGIGLLAGAAYEEPELVMEHLSGETRDVPLIVGGESPSLPTPEVGAAPPPLVRPPKEPQRSVAPTPAPAARGGFAVQVGAFETARSANDLVAQLEQLGFASYVAEEGGAHAPFKVRVGPIPTQDEATALAGRLKTEHRLPTWVLSRGNE